MKTLSLSKGQHRFVIRYEVGQETDVLNHLVEWVHRKDLPFDWFDASVLSHKLGQQITKDLKNFLPKKAA